MNTLRLALLLPLSLLATRGTAETLLGAAGDETLRRGVLGTWLYEQNAGVASVAMYTTYYENGTAIQLIKTKIMLKKATGVWIDNQWSIQNGALHLAPRRFRAHSEDARIDREAAVRQLLSVDDRGMRYLLKGKERRENRANGIPADVQQMIDELSRK